MVVLISNSLSLLASAVDSAMDFLSTFIIFFTARAADTQDMDHYPVGKKRMEPLGVAIFAVAMISSFVQVAIEAIQRLFNKKLALVDLPLAASIAMGVTVGVKLAVWLAYRHFRSTSIRGALVGVC